MEKEDSLVISEHKINVNDENENKFEDDNLSMDQNDRALNLKFTIGFTSNKVGMVQNLTLGNKKEVFLPAAHTGVIYN